MKIVLITDAWEPQINGVAVTVRNVCASLREEGHELLFLHPKMFCGFTLPRTAGIKLVWPNLVKKISHFNPDAVHIFTEGPLGLRGRSACTKLRIPYTTGYHTQFAPILQAWYGIPQPLTRAYIRWFHKDSKAILVPTHSAGLEMSSAGMGEASRIKIWGRGVDPEIFWPPAWCRSANSIDGKKLLCVSRVDPEKGLDDFCALSKEGYECTLVGGGVSLQRLKMDYPKVHFSGPLSPADVAKQMRKHHLFVFPSKNDTFGLVMLEANACGLPVVAYPVTGPKDWVQKGVNGLLARDTTYSGLKLAVLVALQECSPKGAISKADGYSWKKSAQEFLSHLHPVDKK
jgi:glycosyltransferase involved in cell wall biosynthesis